MSLTDALGYAGRGWAVFPLHTMLAGRCSCRRPDCPHPAKHPVTRHGLLEAAIDRAGSGRGGDGGRGPTSAWPPAPPPAYWSSTSTPAAAVPTP